MNAWRIVYSGDQSEKRCTVLGDYSKHYKTAELALEALRAMPAHPDGRTYWTEEVTEKEPAA